MRGCACGGDDGIFESMMVFRNMDGGGGWYLSVSSPPFTCGGAPVEVQTGLRSSIQGHAILSSDTVCYIPAKALHGCLYQL